MLWNHQEKIRLSNLLAFCFFHWNICSGCQFWICKFDLFVIYQFPLTFYLCEFQFKGHEEVFFFNPKCLIVCIIILHISECGLLYMAVFGLKTLC